MKTHCLTALTKASFESARGPFHARSCICLPKPPILYKSEDVLVGILGHTFHVRGLIFAFLINNNNAQPKTVEWIFVYYALPPPAKLHSACNPSAAAGRPLRIFGHNRFLHLFICLERRFVRERSICLRREQTKVAVDGGHQKLSIVISFFPLYNHS